MFFLLKIIYYSGNNNVVDHCNEEDVLFLFAYSVISGFDDDIMIVTITDMFYNIIIFMLL